MLEKCIGQLNLNAENVKQYNTLMDSEKIVNLKIIKIFYVQNVNEYYQTLKKYGKYYTNRQKAEQTCLERLGVKNPFESKVIQNQIIETNLKLFGVKHASQSKVIAAKMSNSNKNRSKKEKERSERQRKQTLKKKYGKNYKKVIANKVKQTWDNKPQKEKEEHAAKIKNTLNKKYNINSPMENEEFKNRCIESNKRHHNGILSSKTKEYKDYMYKTFGSIVPTVICNYYDIHFHSFVELAVWIYCKDHNIGIIREPIFFKYIYNNEIHRYYPDFWIDGIGYVEIKGGQFLDKESGKWVCKFDHSLDGLYEAKHQCAIINNVNIWYKDTYKFYLRYINYYYGKNYLKQFKIDNPYNPTYWCLNYNNPIMYYIPKYNYEDKGINPYNKVIDNDGYCEVKGQGITPFDISK